MPGRRSLSRRHRRDRADQPPFGRDHRGRQAADPLCRLFALLPPRGGKRRARRARAAARPPILQGRAICDLPRRRCGSRADGTQRLLANAESMLQALEIPYQVIETSTGDMGLGKYPDERHRELGAVASANIARPTAARPCTTGRRGGRTFAGATRSARCASSTRSTTPRWPARASSCRCWKTTRPADGRVRLPAALHDADGRRLSLSRSGCRRSRRLTAASGPRALCGALLHELRPARAARAARTGRQLMVDPRLPRQRPHHAWACSARSPKPAIGSTGWGLGMNRGAHAGHAGTARRADRGVRRRAARSILVGWSLGGVFAREVAKLRPDLVAKVVTLGSPFSGDPRANNVWRLYEWIAGHKVDDPPIKTDLAEKPPVPTHRLVVAARRHRLARLPRAAARRKRPGRSSWTARHMGFMTQLMRRCGAGDPRAGHRRAETTSRRRNGAATSGGTRSGRPLALSRIAQVVLARTLTLPSLADELDMPVEARALRRLADPGPAVTRLAGADARADNRSRAGSRPRHRASTCSRRRDCVPVRGRHVLDPAHPGGIVDVAELVDLGVGRGESHARRPAAAMPPAMRRAHDGRPALQSARSICFSEMVRHGVNTDVVSPRSNRPAFRPDRRPGARQRAARATGGAVPVHADGRTLGRLLSGRPHGGLCVAHRRLSAGAARRRTSRRGAGARPKSRPSPASPSMGSPPSRRTGGGSISPRIATAMAAPRRTSTSGW